MVQNGRRNREQALDMTLAVTNRDADHLALAQDACTNGFDQGRPSRVLAAGSAAASRAMRDGGQRHGASCCWFRPDPICLSNIMAIAPNDRDPVARLLVKRGGLGRDGIEQATWSETVWSRGGESNP